MSVTTTKRQPAKACFSSRYLSDRARPNPIIFYLAAALEAIIIELRLSATGVSEERSPPVGVIIGGTHKFLMLVGVFPPPHRDAHHTTHICCYDTV